MSDFDERTAKPQAFRWKQPLDYRSIMKNPKIGKLVALQQKCHHIEMHSMRVFAGIFRLIFLSTCLCSYVACLASLAENRPVAASSVKGPDKKVSAAGHLMQNSDWGVWSQAIDKVVQRKFADFCAQNNLHADPPAICEVKYDISPTGHILNIELSRKTKSPACNAAAETIIRSLDNNAILKLPSGSTESAVTKYSSFNFLTKPENSKRTSAQP